MAFLAAIPAFVSSIFSGGGAAAGAGAAASGGLSVGSLISGAGAVFGGISTFAAANAQAQVAKDNAKIAEKNAEDANKRQQEAVVEQDKLTAAQVGEQLATQAGSGLSLSGRSQLLTRKAAAALGRQDAANVFNEGARETRNYQQQVADFRTQGSMAKAQGTSGLLGGFLSGAGSLIGSSTSTARTPFFNRRAPRAYDPWAGIR